MKIKAAKNTREKLNITAKNLGINKTGNLSITDLLDTMHRYRIKRNSYRLRRKFKSLDLDKYVKKIECQKK